jgi:glycerol-3-phosphate dehydrogenase
MEFDLLVLGGGMYGACVAWDATLRGLSVALVDKADFGGATSSNSLKIIHGGLRYLQHADFRRMRESILERRTLMQIAPHLVHPLPVLLPTYGHGLQGPEVFAAALCINDLVSFDRNRLRDPQKHIPRGRVISKQSCLRHLPGLDSQG